jgi:mannan endo-1,4-beta-mannosidase
MLFFHKLIKSKLIQNAYHEAGHFKIALLFRDKLFLKELTVNKNVMYKTSIFLSATLFFFSFSCSQSKKDISTKPVESISKQVYLDYFNSIKGKACISGHFIRWNYNASLQEITAVYDSSKRWLGMLGADYYGNFQDSVPAPRCDYRLANKVIKSYYPKNGIVNLSAHFINPQSGGSAWSSKIDFDSLFIKDSRIQRVFLTELDSVSMGIKELCNAGVMVMFRPFHEMNGDWFWWGKRERYVDLWKMTYNYMVNTKGLNNMLWCWSPDNGAGDFHQYYPGDEYVDVLGLDIYVSVKDGDEKVLKQYQDILQYKKPFGISEFGCEDEDYNYSNMLLWLKGTFHETVFFLAWRDKWGMVGKKGSDVLLNDSFIINREELINLEKRDE